MGKQALPEMAAIAAEHGVFMTFAQAAEVVGVSVRTLKREVAGGHLALYRVGRSRSYRLRTADVIGMIQRVA